MQIFNTPQRFGAVVQILHWTTALLVVVAWLLGTFGDDLPKGAARDAGLFIHISAGLAVLAIIAVRVLWRLIDPLLVAVPIVGIATQFARGHALPLFGLGEIASPWAADRAFAHSVKEVHEVLANVLLAIAGVHAAAALAHHWIFRDRTLRRMLPGKLS
jgi:cytochrome b561